VSILHDIRQGNAAKACFQICNNARMFL